jgi:hypothetical protein
MRAVKRINPIRKTLGSTEHDMMAGTLDACPTNPQSAEEKKHHRTAYDDLEQPS